MITSEMVYWIVMLDRISDAFVIFAVVFGFLLFAFTAFILTEEENFPWHYPVWVVLELFLIFGAVFLPDTKQMATIYLLPKVVNNKKIQNIGERTLDTGDKLLQLMQQYITEKMTNNNESIKKD